MGPRRLIAMANQIGTFFKSQKRQDAAEGIANHLAKFWDPAMRSRILDYARASGGEGLMPEVQAALVVLSQGTPAAAAVVEAARESTTHKEISPAETPDVARQQETSVRGFSTCR